MLFLLPLPALAATPEELVELRYLDDSGRNDLARRRARALVEADPSDVSAQLTWIRLNRWHGPRVATGMEQTYRAWLAQSPDDPGRKLELAFAKMLVSSGGQSHDVFPERPGPWCEEVLPLLDASAADPELRAKILWNRQFALDRCGMDDQAERQALLALAESAVAARMPATLFRLEDEVVDAEDAALIERLLADQPWRVSDLWRLWREETSGEGLARAREAALRTAEGLTGSDSAAMVSAAFEALDAAGQTDRAEAALARLKALDPQREWFPSVRTSSADEQPAKPIVLSDAATRLAALEAEEPEERWEKVEWYDERATLLLTLGRDEEALALLREAYVIDDGIASNLRYAREAARQGRELRRAARSVDIVIDYLQQGAPYPLQGPEALQRSQAQLADALCARATVALARGRTRQAAEDAARALSLQDSAEAHLLYGLSLEGPDSGGTAFWHLSLGLAGDHRRPDLRPAALARLEALWPEHGLWHPMGLVGWLDIDWALASPSPAEAPREPFPDLEFVLDGQKTRISALPGPLVVDVWATWCGPCVSSLPELDQAARANPGLTFLALSVDAEEATAAAFLSQSQPAFRAAWVGAGGMDALGISGIPATFVLDAEHRVVDRWTGWGPGDERLDEAIRALGSQRAR